MAIGLGVLGLCPQVLWAMTVKELEAALRGRLGAGVLEGPISRTEMGALIERYPDRVGK